MYQSYLLYIVSKLSVNQLTVFHCSILQSFTIKITIIFTVIFSSFCPSVSICLLFYQYPFFFIELSSFHRYLSIYLSVYYSICIAIYQLFYLCLSVCL